MCNIMIVEDNTLFRTSLLEALHLQFPKLVILAFSDGGAVLQTVNDLALNLIFMDIKLPGQNGIELTKQIKANHAETHIVLMTLHDQSEYRELALKSGADYFVLKGALNNSYLARLVRSVDILASI